MTYREALEDTIRLEIVRFRHSAVGSYERTYIASAIYRTMRMLNNCK